MPTTGHPPMRGGVRYNVATQHRGLRSYTWTWGLSLQLVALLALQWLLLALAYPAVQDFWQQLLAWAWPRLGLGSAEQVRATLEPLWQLQVPLVAVQTVTPPPQAWHWGLSTLGCVLLLAGSWLLSRERLPLIYLLRTVGLLWLASLLLHLWLPSANNLNLTHLLNDLLRIGSLMLWVLPPIHALVLYIFPVPQLLKASATVLALLFACIAVPLQVASIAWLISQGSSLLLLPVYMLLTFLPHLAAQLGIYGYFVSLARAPS